MTKLNLLSCEEVGLLFGLGFFFFFFLSNQESNFTFESKSCGKADELITSSEKRFTHST